MVYQPEQTVAEVVSQDIAKAHIFKKYGIDFCCGGGISLQAAAAKKGINASTLLAELNSIPAESSGSIPFHTWSARLLCDYIEETHHRYVLDALPLLRAYADKVVRVHGESHPPLKEIAGLLAAVDSELRQHMQKEERILFPWIRSTELSRRNGQPAPPLPFGSFANPISMMHLEHESAGEAMHRIADLTMQYTPPHWACNTFKAFYDKLREFEEDLHIHVHLENNILFPKTMAMDEATEPGQGSPGRD
jgi:regulator of cell morphogenesis and NO signaling